MMLPHDYIPFRINLLLLHLFSAQHTQALFVNGTANWVLTQGLHTLSLLGVHLAADVIECEEEVVLAVHVDWQLNLGL